MSRGASCGRRAWRVGLVGAAWVWGMAVSAEVVCGTWNLRWFPSGRAEHRAAPAAEAAATAQAAETLRTALPPADAGDDIILFFQELRDTKACSKLVAGIGRTNLSVAVVSAFRDWDKRLGWQQCGIATTLPVVETSWSYWRHAHKVLPPRGYAYAVLDGGERGLIACFCIHLKSNYGASKAEVRALNARKREVAAEQLAALTRQLRTRDGRAITHILVAGDFNTDPYGGAFPGEKTCDLLKAAGFVTGWDGLPLACRGTHPGRGRYPPATLDFIFYRGFAGAETPELGPIVAVSDHRLVYQRLR